MSLDDVKFCEFASNTTPITLYIEYNGFEMFCVLEMNASGNIHYHSLFHMVLTYHAIKDEPTYLFTFIKKPIAFNLRYLYYYS